MSLIEILLRAAEEGFYTEVLEIFSVPIKQCPEVLCLGLVQFEVGHEARQCVVCFWLDLEQSHTDTIAWYDLNDMHV